MRSDNASDDRQIEALLRLRTLFLIGAVIHQLIDPFVTAHSNLNDPTEIERVIVQLFKFVRQL